MKNIGENLRFRAMSGVAGIVALLSVCFIGHAQEPTIRFYTKANHRYIAFDSLSFALPSNGVFSPAVVLRGIYALGPDTLKRHKVLINKNLVFLTTFDDVGMGRRGYLYVFDIRTGACITDKEFGHEYLYSSAGVFLVDTANNQIFVVDKPEWYAAKGAAILPATLYEVKDRLFRDIKSVYEPGADIPRDTAIISFYKNASLAHSKGVLPLPKHWWKPKEDE